MFSHYSGPATLEWYPKIASTALDVGDLLYWDGSGAVQPADATSGNHAGICMKTVAATDSDYASTTRIPILRITDDTILRADVGTGTLTTAMIGEYRDLADETGIDVSATSKLVVQIVGFVSASVALIKVNAMAVNVNVATT